MRKKEFATNLVRGLGYKVTGYKTDSSKTFIYTEKDGEKGVFNFYVDPSEVSDTVYCKLKPVRLPRKVDNSLQKNSASAINQQRTAMAWLMERGFQAVAILKDYHYKPGKCYLEVVSKGYPWQQAATHMSDKEVIEDALNNETRYKAHGFVNE